MADWKKTEAKGFLRFALKYTVIGAAVVSVVGVLFILTKRPFFGYVGIEVLRVALIIGAVGGFLGSISNWMANEIKENRIRDKEKETSDSQES